MAVNNRKAAISRKIPLKSKISAGFKKLSSYYYTGKGGICCLDSDPGVKGRPTLPVFDEYALISGVQIPNPITEYSTMEGASAAAGKAF